MIIAAAVLALLAALLHAYIWYLESFVWTTRARSVFGTSAEEALATKEMAFNQGYYNLFLGIIAAAGAVCVLLGRPEVGLALIGAGTGSMLAASLVLALGSPDKRGAAAKQGILPALTLITLLVAGFWG